MSTTRTRAALYNLDIDLVRLRKLAPRTPAAPAIANVATANATDLATAQALANQLKTTLNLLLTEMRARGQIA